MTKQNETIVVQCKRHGKPAGPAFVRDLYGAMQHEHADGAILACTGGFTDGAYDFAKGKPMRLLDLPAILLLASSSAS